MGKALLARVASAAVEQGCSRLDWSVLTWNEPALQVYEHIGAVRMEEWRRMRMTGETLRRLAAGTALAAKSKPDNHQPGYKHSRESDQKHLPSAAMESAL